MNTRYFLLGSTALALSLTLEPVSAQQSPGTPPPSSPGQSYPPYPPQYPSYPSQPYYVPPAPPPEALVHPFLDGGFADMVGSTASQLQGGYTVGGGVAITAGRGNPLDIRLDVNYIYSDLTRELLAADLPSGASYDRGHADLWDGTLDLQFNLTPPGRVRGYLFGGGGAYDTRISVRSLTFSTTPVCDPFGFCGNGAFLTYSAHEVTKFGWNAGAGLQIPAGPYGPKFFLEGRFTRVLQGAGEPALKFVPITVGVRF